jgi:23S rRNA (adenine2503-C2)-methyltransferase
MKHNRVEDTVEAALSYGMRHNRKITVAYLLLPGINDSALDKRRLRQWFGNENVRINLLPLNRSIGDCPFATRGQLQRFKRDLEVSGLEVSIRESQGRRIQAACGQLATRNGDPMAHLVGHY